MSLSPLLEKLRLAPESVTFDEVMAVVEACYMFRETAFSNGDLANAAGQNNGSCKIFALGQINQLSEQQTLHCFGDFYRCDVLGHPGGEDHQNIRNFMQHGWAGVSFDGVALSPK
ncbi:MAG: HopJ type III effector protein [Gammaproteobacteria bacterium]|nr:HopJ type III effector protein [Gammaproteobacteria bacterium]